MCGYLSELCLWMHFLPINGCFPYCCLSVSVLCAFLSDCFVAVSLVALWWSLWDLCDRYSTNYLVVSLNAVWLSLLLLWGSFSDCFVPISFTDVRLSLWLFCWCIHYHYVIARKFPWLSCDCLPASLIKCLPFGCFSDCGVTVSWLFGSCLSDCQDNVSLTTVRLNLWLLFCFSLSAVWLSHWLFCVCVSQLRVSVSFTGVLSRLLLCTSLCDCCVLISLNVVRLSY